MLDVTKAPPHEPLERPAELVRVFAKSVVARDISAIIEIILDPREYFRFH